MIKVVSMKERPILFNGEMVRAVLAGQKTQTRRVIINECPQDECPYGQPGSRLCIFDFPDPDIILEITDVRVERVQDITNDDAIASGAYEVRKVGDDIAHATWTMDGLDWRYDTPKEAFAATWDSLYAARGLGWDVNPWVWVVTFKRAEEVCQK